MLRRAAAIVIAASVALTGQGLLGLAGAQASPPEVTPTLAPCPAPCGPTDPPSDQTKINQNDHLKYGGNATAGSTIVDGELLIYNNDGSLYDTRVAKLDPVPLPTGVMIRGTKAPMGLTDLPLDGGWVILEVTAENADGRSTGRSDPVYVDLTLPRIEGTFLTETNQIEIRFSEPVKSPKVGDLALDWEIDGEYWKNEDPVQPVDSVTGSGKVRTLTLAEDQRKDEDATPSVAYRPAEQMSGVGIDVLKQYRDEAGNYVSGDTWDDPAARDLVPPSRVPVIDAIAGAAGTNVIGTDTTPAVEISNLRSDGPAGPHKGRVYLESNDEPGLQTSGSDADTLLGAVAANDSGEATIQVEDALSDDEYTIYAVAADRAKCNPNSGSAECPNLTAAQSAPAATYVLDTVAPLPLFAAVDDEFGAGVIKVRFSEGIAPADSAGTWTVQKGGLPVTIASIASHSQLADGDTRLISLQDEQVDQGEAFTVAWAPTGGSYADRAGNELGAFSGLEVEFGVPPVVDLASPPAFIANSSHTVRGVVTEGRSVLPGDMRIEIFDGPTTDGSPIATGLANDATGEFAVPVQLGADGAYTLSVRATRVEQGVAGPARTTSFTLDTAAPLIPSFSIDDDIVRGGQQGVGLSWTVDDPNLSVLTLQLIERPGAAPETIDTLDAGDTEFAWTVKPGVNSENARILLTAIDKAGNAQFRHSIFFVIDSISPTFEARTIDPRRVRVEFSERVTGTTANNEWFVDLLMVDSVPSGITESSSLVLTTAQGQEIGSNAHPTVTYRRVHTQTPPPPTTPFQDRAGNPLALRAFPGLFPEVDKQIGLPHESRDAADGIAPGAPTLNATPGLVDRGSIPLTGTGDGTPVNQVVVRRVGPSEATYSSVVNSNGTFGVLAGLEQDAVNVFRVSIEDEAGNSSAVRQLVVSEDSSGPLVTVKDRKKRIRAKKKALVAQWTSVEPHPGFSALYLEFRKRNGRTRMLTIADQTVEDGREKVRFPKNLRKKMRKGKIKAIRFHVFSFDALGHVGSDTGRWVKVRGKRRRR